MSIAATNPVTFSKFTTTLVEKSDNLSKTMGVVKDVFKISSEVLKLIPGMGAAAGAVACGVFSSINGAAKGTIGAYGLLSRPADWEKTSPSAMETAKKVTLTVGQVLEFSLFIADPFLKAFEVTALTIGKLPVVETAMKGIYALNSAIGIWMASGSLNEASEKQEQTGNNLARWSAFDSNEENRAAKIQVYEDKIAAASIEIEKQGGNKKLESKITLWNGYKAALGSHEGAESLKTSQIAKLETRLENCEKIKTKSWVSIAADIAKISIIVLGVLSVALAAYLLAVPASVVTFSLLGIGFAASLLGFGKMIYTEFAQKPVEEPKFKIN